MASADISLSDIAQCSICLETWTDPRSLTSCDHTFCLQCLKNYVQKKDEENEELLCPVCRKEFIIPYKGLDVLPKNFIHQQLLDASRAALLRQQSSATTGPSQEPTRDPAILCELCSGNVTASRYCVDCDQNMCRTCSATHLRIRATRNHKVVDFLEKQNSHLIRKLCNSYCEQHEEERVKLYCEETGCQKLLCTICHATEHVGHKCVAIKTAAQGFVDRIAGCHGNMDKRITKTKLQLAEVKKEIEEFLENISEKEQMITIKKEDMIQMIETEHLKLLNELKYIKEKRLSKQLKMKVEEAESELLVLETFQVTAKELIDKGSACDICRSADDIIAEANSFINSEKDSTLELHDPIEVSFTPATIPDVKGTEIHLIGVMECKGSILNQSPLLYQSKKHQTTLNQIYDKMSTYTNELQIKINQLETELKLERSEVDKINKDRKLLETNLNDIKVLNNLHAQADADREKQLQQLQQQIKNMKNKHSQEEEVHQKETQKLQAQIMETKANCNRLNTDQQKLKGELDKITRLKDQYAKNELVLKGKLEEMTRLKDQLHVSLQKQVEDLRDELKRSKDETGQRDENVETPKKQPTQVEEKNEAIDRGRSALFVSQSTVVRVIPGADKNWVCGVAVLGSQLFIARGLATCGEVYDTNNVTTTPRLLKISDLRLYCPQLAACPHYNCLYVRHWISSTETVIYRVELSDSSVSRWGVAAGYEPRGDGLSITRDHTVLVTVYYTKRVYEYSTSGELMSVIRLDISIDNPYHCIQLSDGNFVICHIGSKQHRVCIVDSSGRIIKSYGGSHGSGVDQLDRPFQLSVDKYDQVFVADRDNKRVQLLSPTLTLLGTVQIPGHRLNHPVALHFDQINHRLYVNRGSDVLIVELSNVQK